MALQLSLFSNETRRPSPPRIGHASVVDREAKSILSPAKGMVSHFDFTLNPYSGCSFGCSYCYAAYFVPDPRKQAEWGTWIEVKKNAVDLLRKERRLPGSKIYLGSVTDPYQPIEMQTGLTRALLEVMLEVRPQPRLVIQTRSPLIVRDLDLLAKFENVRVNMSVPTDDDSMRKLFEPAAPSILRRIQALKMLRAARVKTGVCISPMLPLRDPEGFMETIKSLTPERLTWSWFHEGNRPYAAGTRPGGWAHAAKIGWTREKYEETAARLQAAAGDANFTAFAPQ